MTDSGELCPDSWPLITCEGTGGCSHLGNINPVLAETIKTAAVEYLWRWSGRRFGLCEVALRPCPDENGCYVWSAAPRLGTAASGLYPFIRNGNWYNAICGRCNNQRCGCDDLSTIILPGPADSIVEVWIDGELLDPSAYRLDNQGLSRIDGSSWPRCQNMANDPGDESPVGDTSDTFLVKYMRGTPVPAAGKLAAGTLACEMAKRSCGDKTCRLPKRATVVSREGVTVQMPTDAQLFENGAIGLDEVDYFLASVQRDNKQGWAVTSPDAKRFRTAQ